MSAKQEPVPFEVYEPGVYLHGTKADLAVGEKLVSGRESNFEHGRAMNYVYFTATLDAATWGAELASGEGRGRIYVVEPMAEFEDDPNLTDKKFPGNPTHSFRTREPLRRRRSVRSYRLRSPGPVRTAAGTPRRRRVEVTARRGSLRSGVRSCSRMRSDTTSS